MNYFAHGYPFIERPYFLAGTAVPDWLSVVNRRMRVRSKNAALWVADSDPRVADLAAGIQQHHLDDGWFHQTRAFVELSLDFSRQLRELLKDDEGFRPSFLGHILVELLLDAALIEDGPTLLDDYYAAIDTLDPPFVADCINRMATRQSDRLALLIRGFSGERFLYDYVDDAKLLGRLNRVMQRVGLPILPEATCQFFPKARQQVRARQGELLVGRTQSPKPKA